MSGFKRATVTISEQEYRRLHESDMKRRFAARKEKARVEHGGVSQELLNTLEELGQRQQQLEEALRDAGQYSNERSEEEVQAILAQNALYYQQLAEMIQATSVTSNEAFAELSDSFTAQIQRQHAEYARSLQAFAERLEISQQGQRDKEEVARGWLERSMLLVQLIQQQFDQQRFAPGRLAGLRRILELAENNLNQGLPEASLQGSQQAFLQLNDLHSELELRTLEWQSEFERAYRSMREVIAELETNSSVNAFGLQGEELRDQVDVDYWTDGKHRQLLDHCREMLQVLVQDKKHIPAEDLRRTHTDWIPEIIGRLESIIYEARLNALNSQLRMNIAERALEALETQGFMLSEAGYTDNDMRSAFTASLDNPDGSQVTIQVLPGNTPKEDLSNDLVVMTRHSEVKTRQEVYTQWQELRRSLTEGDLNVSPPEIHSEPPTALPDHVQPSPLLKRPVIRSER